MTIFGRVFELRQARDAIASPHGGVVAICGPRGAGKTTLASELAAHFRDRSNHFDRTPAVILGHGKGADVLADEIYRSLTDTATRAQRPEDLPGLIACELQKAADQKVLLFVDNVEEDALASGVLQDLLGSWTTGAGHVLMLTVRDWQEPLDGPDVENLYVLKLGGLAEPEAVLEILGPGLRYRHGKPDLIAAGDALGNLPQALLYLRWADPPEVDTWVEAYRAEPGHASIESLRSVLTEIPGSELIPALGLLRQIDIPHDLLRRFWLQLSSNSPVVDETQSSALTERLLVRGAGPSTSYRVHPSVHLDLRRISEERGRSWLRLVHEVALEIFTDRLASDPDDLSACHEVVHHALVLDRLSVAVAAPCDPVALARWRTLGLSVHVEPALADLRRAIETLPQMWSPLDKAGVFLSSAEIASDLGRPGRCLAYLGEAEHSLDDCGEPRDALPMQRQIWRQMAISHANLGATATCIGYYGRVIGSDRGIDDPATALCMGYLGYEYCDQLDFDKAREWTRLALEACPRSRDASVFARNLSNRALVHLYEQELDDSRALLEDAVELVSAPGSAAADVREHGRALINLGTVYLSQTDVPLQKAAQCFAQALALTSKAGDARRSAIANGRLGLVAAFEDDFGRAARMLLDAVRVHGELGDVRNMTLELLDLLAVRALRNHASSPDSSSWLLSNVGSLLPDATHADVRREVEQTLRSLDGSRRDRYVRFWELCHAPNMLRRAQIAPAQLSPET